MKYRDLVKTIEADGWQLERTVGSHQQYRHPTKLGTVTVPAGRKMGRGVPAGTMNSVLKQAGLGESMDYTVVIELAPDGSYSAYVPDLPGCVSCGDTLDEVRSMIREAVKLHLESLRSHGEPVPPPTTTTWTVHAA